MRDEYDRGGMLFHHINHEIDYLSPNGNIKHRNRFICNDETWVKNEGPGHGHPLTLSAAQLVWIAVQILLGGKKLDLRNDLLHPFLHLSLSLRYSLDPQRFRNNFLDNKSRIQ